MGGCESACTTTPDLYLWAIHPGAVPTLPPTGGPDRLASAFARARGCARGASLELKNPGGESSRSVFGWVHGIDDASFPSTFAEGRTMTLALPKPIAAYFTADSIGSDAVARCFTENAVVKDEGHTDAGRVAIKK